MMMIMMMMASTAQHAVSVTARLSSVRSSHRGEAATGRTCYGAFVPSFPWCSGYEKVDYNCGADGRYCAAETCIEDCYSCAIDYPGAVLHAASGRCCLSIDPVSGACTSPFPAVAPWNEDYLWPNHHPALLVEEPAAYPHGPRVWSNGSAYNESGAFVFTMNSPGAKTDAGCPALPSNTTFNVRLVHPISLVAHGAALDNCVLACNHTAVAVGEQDPCLPGSVSLPGVAVDMRCYWLGPEWLHDPDMGVCGYNCTGFVPGTADYCDQRHRESGDCESYCDPRYFPSASAAAVQGQI